MASLSVVPASAYGLSDHLASALDPVRFARSVGMEPDSWQSDVLRSPASRMLLNCSRQSGKSTTAAALSLHRAVHHPGSLVLVLSPSERQSMELFRVIAGLHARTGALPVEQSLQRMTLRNGSRIVSLPGSEQTVRGYSGVDVLIVDEASRVSDDLYYAVSPMLAVSGGRLIAMSTPFGKRGWWSDAWHGSQPWKRVKVTAEECPRISPAFLEEQRESMGDWWFQQEFLCQFVDNESSVFRHEDIRRARSADVEVWEV